MFGALPARFGNVFFGLKRPFPADSRRSTACQVFQSTAGSYLPTDSGPASGLSRRKAEHEASDHKGISDEFRRRAWSE
jgi:hypothetical protein